MGEQPALLYPQPLHKALHLGVHPLSVPLLSCQPRHPRQERAAHVKVVCPHGRTAVVGIVRKAQHMIHHSVRNVPGRDQKPFVSADQIGLYKGYPYGSAGV